MIAGMEKLQERWRHRGAGEVVLIDNRDSFVYNLAHRLAQVGAQPVVVRSDEVTAREVFSWRPRAIVLSPGPGHPLDAGCSIELVRALPLDLPLLGVCLGHQAIACAFGGEVVASGAPRHGKASRIAHDGEGVFKNLGGEMEVGRYHSLVAREPLGEGLIVSARCDGFVMALRHESRPIVGVQFHPESVLTGQGLVLLENFTRLVGAQL